MQALKRMPKRSPRLNRISTLDNQNGGPPHSWCPALKLLCLFLPVLMALVLLLKFCPEMYIHYHPKVGKILNIFTQRLITTRNIGMVMQRHRNIHNKKLLKLIRKQQNNNIKMTKNG